MILRLYGGYLVAVALMTIAQLAIPFPSENPLATPEAIFVEHLFIIGIGTWALIELIQQGRRMATRDEIGKLRDDVTAVMAEQQDALAQRLQDMNRRIDSLLKGKLHDHS